MCIDETRGRIVAFHVVNLNPVNYVPMRSWYRRESAIAFATRLHLDSEWRIHVVRYAGDRFVWVYAGCPHVWKRVPPDRYPDWLLAKLEAANAKMNKDEQDA